MAPWPQSLGLPLINCTAFGKLLSFSEPQFSCLYDGNNNTSLTALVRTK